MKPNKPRYTPGPWIAVGAWVEHPDDSIPDICSCDVGLERSYEEICANTRLIAASPALISTLQDLLNLAYDLCPDEPEMYEFDERVARANDLIKSIL